MEQIKEIKDTSSKISMINKLFAVVCMAFIVICTIIQCRHWPPNICSSDNIPKPNCLDHFDEFDCKVCNDYSIEWKIGDFNVTTDKNENAKLDALVYCFQNDDKNCELNFESCSCNDKYICKPTNTPYYKMYFLSDTHRIMTTPNKTYCSFRHSNKFISCDNMRQALFLLLN